MKKLGLAVMVCVIAGAVSAGAQDKPRVFVQGERIAGRDQFRGRGWRQALGSVGIEFDD